MHGCNEVTLVWGSLRLAPITHVCTHIHTYNKDALTPMYRVQAIFIKVARYRIAIKLASSKYGA